MISRTLSCYVASITLLFITLNAVGITLRRADELYSGDEEMPPISISRKDGSSPNFSSGPDSLSNNNSSKAVVIAVVVTATVSLTFAALFFFCCQKCGKGFESDQTDEGPLLSVSLSELSGGSSHKPYLHGNSIGMEKVSSLPGNAPSNQSGNHRPSSFNRSVIPEEPTLLELIAAEKLAESRKFPNIQSSEIMIPTDQSPETTNSSSLKPPPGRMSISSPEPPPNPPPPQPPSAPFPSPAPPSAPSPPPPPNKSSARPPPPPPSRNGAKPPPPKILRPPTGPPIKDESQSSKTKLKPFFWDKVLASPNHSMVWHDIKSGSFQFDEDMIEALFGYVPANSKEKGTNRKDLSQDPSTIQYIQIIDSKKAQNLSILLRALNVTTLEVCDALREGNELPSELIETLLKMAPTTEEELKLRLFNGDPAQLGPAERFLKAVIDVPFAFKRMELLLFMHSLHEEASIARESFQTFEVACKELRSSRLFLKLLEAVLKTGNRMNDGTFRGGAQAFKLDTLLKLADVKGADGKTTLVHFVVQEIIRSEGIRSARADRASRSSQSMSSVTSVDLDDTAAAVHGDTDTEETYRKLGLQVISRLGNEMENVRKAATLDADALSSTVSRLANGIQKAVEFLKAAEEEAEGDRFRSVLRSFVEKAEVDVSVLSAEEKRISALVKSTADYFHGNAGKDEGLRLFVIVRDFLLILDKICREIESMQAVAARAAAMAKVAPPSDNRFPASPDLARRLFPMIAERRPEGSSSGSEDD